MDMSTPTESIVTLTGTVAVTTARLQFGHFNTFIGSSPREPNHAKYRMAYSINEIDRSQVHPSMQREGNGRGRFCYDDVMFLGIACYVIRFFFAFSVTRFSPLPALNASYNV